MSGKENTQHKELVRDRLEQLKTIANQAKTPNILSAIISIIGEVEQWLHSNNNDINANDIDAKLGHAYIMVTLDSGIVPQTLVDDVLGLPMPIEVGQVESGLSEEQIAQIIKMSLKLYDIFTKHGGLLQGILEKLEDIEREGGGLIQAVIGVIESTVEKEKTANEKEEQYHEEIEEIKDFLKSDSNILFTNAVNAALHVVVQQIKKDVKTRLSEEEVPSTSPSGINIEKVLEHGIQEAVR